MARKLDSYEFRRGAPTKYPWDEWFDGNIWELIPGEDFATTSEQFRRTAIAAAHRYGMTINTAMGSEKSVILQTHKIEDALPDVLYVSEDDDV